MSDPIVKKRGRPGTTPEVLDMIVRKLEPYLKKGLSLRKACLEAHIPKTAVYYDYKRNEDFADKIDCAKQYYSILINDIIHKHILAIRSKQNKGEVLNGEDIRFIQWVATTSNSTKDEFGNSISLDVEQSELERKRIDGILQRMQLEND